MKVDVKITEKQAARIVDALYNNNFFLSGYGHFDVKREEFTELIFTAFNSKKIDEEVLLLYKRMLRLRGM